jgi:hypothetical protein
LRLTDLVDKSDEAEPLIDINHLPFGGNPASLSASADLTGHVTSSMLCTF